MIRRWRNLGTWIVQILRVMPKYWCDEIFTLYKILNKILIPLSLSLSLPASNTNSQYCFKIHIIWRGNIISFLHFSPAPHNIFLIQLSHNWHFSSVVLWTIFTFAQIKCKFATMRLIDSHSWKEFRFFFFFHFLKITKFGLTRHGAHLIGHFCCNLSFSFTYFSSGGGGISMAEGVPGGVFSFSIMAKGASGNGLTEFVSIRRHPILALI